MKLFVWDEPFAQAYAGGVIFALAPDEETARAEVEKALTERTGHRLPLDGPLGEPRVYDTATAEIYEWTE